jgi:capsid protein
MLAAVTAALLAACSTYDVSPAGVTSLSCGTVATEVSSTYDALNPKGRRKAPTADTRVEERHLPDGSRRKLIGGLRELRRNSSLLSWMVRRHLDYVATHTFQSQTGDDVWDDEVERWMREESAADRCDVRGILGLDQFVRLAESSAVIDGDLGVLFIDNDSGRLQGIEADRIKDPVGQVESWSADQQWYGGVRISDVGKPIEYAIHKRVSGWSSLVWERNVSAANLHLHAYCDRFDQYRGVSPLASAYNEIRDVYEGMSLHLVQAKVAGLFGMKVTRNADLAMGQVTGGDDADGNEDRSTYSVNFGSGPIFLDMDPGDDAEFLSNDNPAANMQDFWRFVTLVALKALDLPYGLFDESAANFFGNKTAWLSYDRSCDVKRARIRMLLDRITRFKMAVAIRDGRLRPPRTGRVDLLSPANKPWAWVPRKMPWWRPLEEVTASLKAIEGGLTTPQRVCAESDQGDWYENILEIARAQKFADEQGVAVSWSVSDQLAQDVADSRKSAAKQDTDDTEDTDE